MDSSHPPLGVPRRLAPPALVIVPLRIRPPRSSHEPVAAVVSTPAYRAAKFVRRNRGALSAAGLVALAVIAGAGAPLWQASRATRAAELAAEEAEKARMVADLMGDLFRLSDPSETLGDTITARDLLDRGTERIRTEFGDQPVVQAELLSEVARVYTSLALYRRARPLVERALELRTAEFGEESLEASESLDQLGALLIRMSEPGDGIPLLERSIAIREARAERPDALLVDAKAELGWAVRQAGEHTRAAALFSEALQEQQGLGPNPSAVADLMFGLAASYHDNGMLEEADSVFTSIIDRMDPEASPTPNAIEALSRIGVLRRLREQYREADPILRSAMEMGTRLLGPEHPFVLEASQEYAMNAWALGRWDEAEGILRITRTTAERVLGPEHEMTATIGGGLATVLEESGHFDESLLYEQIWLEEKVRRHEGRDHPGIASSLAGVGRSLALAGRTTEARSYLDRADAMIERLGTVPSVYSIHVERARGIMLAEEGDFEGADEHFRRAIRLCDELLTRRTHRFATAAKFEYATMLVAAGRNEEAVGLLDETEALIIERVGEPHPLVDRVRALRAEAISG